MLPEMPSLAPWETEGRPRSDQLWAGIRAEVLGRGEGGEGVILLPGPRRVVRRGSGRRLTPTVGSLGWGHLPVRKSTAKVSTTAFILKGRG